MTATPWERFDYGPWDDTAVVPQSPPDEATRRAKDLPPTLLPVAGEGVVQRAAYDPAVKHHMRGMRLTEPQFASARTGEAWLSARRRALDLVLAAVAGSGWADHLVLRGSVLLKAWYGDAAREPGDLDFVVVPSTWALEDERTDALLDDIARAAEDLSRAGGGVLIDASGAVSGEIWTYDRVPGRRLVLPWTAPADGPDALPSGSVQLDFVFNETLPAPSVRTGIPRHDGGEPTVLTTAGPELSLAWKLLWLMTDMHPEAKDLYDAVLLAENCRLPYELLRRVLVTSEEYREGSEFDLVQVLEAASYVDWPEFRKDHPAFPVSEAACTTRLAVALAPVFPPAEEKLYARLAAAYASTTDTLREKHGNGGMAAVETWFCSRRLHSIEALIAVRGLLGGEECTWHAAADLLASFRYPDRNPGREQSGPFTGEWGGTPHLVAAWLEAAEAAEAAEAGEPAEAGEADGAS
ncbi:nucleotidyl transferase AbiEii/AbiGii toxin family protein [Streptomyces cinnamoneus]|uniref:nucleotidyl transferase AbiEii/AbiGii toxin family protein n=1 Tax=Streptomyces cinnamoneus TaxID=53446 RepID=UPI003440A2A0